MQTRIATLSVPTVSLDPDDRVCLSVECVDGTTTVITLANGEVGYESMLLALQLTRRLMDALQQRMRADEPHRVF